MKFFNAAKGLLALSILLGNNNNLKTTTSLLVGATSDISSCPFNGEFKDEETSLFPHVIGFDHETNFSSSETVAN